MQKTLHFSAYRLLDRLLSAQRVHQRILQTDFVKLTLIFLLRENEDCLA